MADDKGGETDRVLHPREHALLDMNYRCRHCRQTFKALHNFGTWQCWCHRGVVSEGRYSCCGAGVRSHGCVPCDHWMSRNSPLGTTHRFRIAMFRYMLDKKVNFAANSFYQPGNKPDDEILVRRSKPID